MHSYSGHKLCSTEITSNLVQSSRIHLSSPVYFLDGDLLQQDKIFQIFHWKLFSIYEKSAWFYLLAVYKFQLVTIFYWKLLFPGESFTLINTLKQMLLSGLLLPLVLPLSIKLPTSFPLKLYRSCIPYAKQGKKLHKKITFLYMKCGSTSSITFSLLVLCFIKEQVDWRS